jgi:hypothetical protein
LHTTKTEKTGSPFDPEKVVPDVVNEVWEEETQQPTRGSAADARQFQLFKD